MDKETNIQRVEKMLYDICGCSPKDAKIVLEACLKNAEKMIKENKWECRY